MATTLEVRQGDATAGAIRDAWVEILAEIATPDSQARSAVVAQGTDPAALAAAPVDVEQRDGSIGLTLLIEIGAPVAAYILQTLWEDFVRPRLRERFGHDAGPAIDQG
jgi:hypothetical protein